MDRSGSRVKRHSCGPKEVDEKENVVGNLDLLLYKHQEGIQFLLMRTNLKIIDNKAAEWWLLRVTFGCFEGGQGYFFFALVLFNFLWVIGGLKV